MKVRLARRGRSEQAGEELGQVGQAGRQKKADRRRQAREMGRQEKQTGRRRQVE